MASLEFKIGVSADLEDRMKGWLHRHVSFLVDIVSRIFHRSDGSGQKALVSAKAPTVSDQWTPLAVTNVQYVQGDIVSFLSACLALSPSILTVALVTLVATRRDTQMILLLVGVLVNECVNFALQHAIREPRPILRPGETSGPYGMPSGGSQFMWFMAAYLTFLAKLRWARNCESRMQRRWTVFLLGVFVCLSFAVSCARVYLAYDTVKQGVVGGLVGATCGCVWYSLGRLTIRKWFPQTLNHATVCCRTDIDCCTIKSVHKRSQATSTRNPPIKPKAGTEGANFFVTARPRSPKPLNHQANQNDNTGSLGTLKGQSFSEEIKSFKPSQTEPKVVEPKLSRSLIAETSAPEQVKSAVKAAAKTALKPQGGMKDKSKNPGDFATLKKHVKGTIE